MLKYVHSLKQRTKQMSQTKQKLLEHDAAVLQAIAHELLLVQQQTGYGSIEITVHDGRVTQIERREKVRFEHKASHLKI